MFPVRKRVVVTFCEGIFFLHSIIFFTISVRTDNYMSFAPIRLEMWWVPVLPVTSPPIFNRKTIPAHPLPEYMNSRESFAQIDYMIYFPDLYFLQNPETLTAALFIFKQLYNKESFNFRLPRDKRNLIRDTQTG